MKKIKSMKRWAICQLNKREVAEYGFQFAVIHPDNAETLYACTPADTDWECDTIEAAISWIENYDHPVEIPEEELDDAFIAEVEEELAKQEPAEADAIRVSVTGNVYKFGCQTFTGTFTVSGAAGIHDLVAHLASEGICVDHMYDADTGLCYMTEAQVQAAGICQFSQPSKDIWCYRDEGCFYKLDHIMTA